MRIEEQFERITKSEKGVYAEPTGKTKTGDNIYYMPYQELSTIWTDLKEKMITQINQRIWDNPHAKDLMFRNLEEIPVPAIFSLFRNPVNIVISVDINEIREVFKKKLEVKQKFSESIRSIARHFEEMYTKASSAEMKFDMVQPLEKYPEMIQRFVDTCNKHKIALPGKCNLIEIEIGKESKFIKSYIESK